MADINLVGPSYDLDSAPSGVQRTVNLVPVPIEPGNERTAWALKDVPGLISFPKLVPFIWYNDSEVVEIVTWTNAASQVIPWFSNEA